MTSDLPPGTSLDDLPGNSIEDARMEALWERLDWHPVGRVLEAFCGQDGHLPGDFLMWLRERYQDNIPEDRLRGLVEKVERWNS